MREGRLARGWWRRRNVSVALRAYGHVPFGASELDLVTRVAHRCDQCEGDPLCVKHCPTGALGYVPEDRLAAAEQRQKIEVLINLQRLIRS